MLKEQRTRNQKGVTVIIRHVAAPDAQKRLSLAVNALLRVTAKSTISEDEKLPHHSPKEEELTTGKLNDTEKGQQDA